MVTPPAALIAAIPSAPSEPLPDSTTPIASSARSSASAHQFGERLQTTGRRAYADDRKLRASRRGFRHPLRATAGWSFPLPRRDG